MENLHSCVPSRQQPSQRSQRSPSEPWSRGQRVSLGKVVLPCRLTHSLQRSPTRMPNRLLHRQSRSPGGQQASLHVESPQAPSACRGPGGREQVAEGGCASLPCSTAPQPQEAQLSALPCCVGEKREASSACVYADEGQAASPVPCHHLVRDERERTEQIRN